MTLKQIRLWWAAFELGVATLSYLLVAGVLLWRSFGDYGDPLVYVALALLLLGARARPCHEGARDVLERDRTKA